MSSLPPRKTLSLFWKLSKMRAKSSKAKNCLRSRYRRPLLSKTNKNCQATSHTSQMRSILNFKNSKESLSFHVSCALPFLTFNKCSIFTWASKACPSRSGKPITVSWAAVKRSTRLSGAWKVYPRRLASRVRNFKEPRCWSEEIDRTHQQIRRLSDCQVTASRFAFCEIGWADRSTEVVVIFDKHCYKDRQNSKRRLVNYF